ncbi:MAG: hypothetical protein RR140_01270 [Clostridia bacterium]
MKRVKILTTIAALALGTFAMVFGVLSARTLNFSVGANLSFDLQRVQVTINGGLTGAKKNATNENFAIADTTAALGTVDANGNITKLIYEYNPTGAPDAIGEWAIGPIFFNNKLKTDIVFSVKVINYTPNKKIKVSIQEMNSTYTAVADALGTIATHKAVDATALAATSGVTITPSAEVVATMTYTLKDINMATATATNLYLKVTLEETV